MTPAASTVPPHLGGFTLIEQVALRFDELVTMGRQDGARALADLATNHEGITIAVRGWPIEMDIVLVGTTGRGRAVLAELRELRPTTLDARSGISPWRRWTSGTSPSQRRRRSPLALTDSSRSPARCAPRHPPNACPPPSCRSPPPPGLTLFGRPTEREASHVGHGSQGRPSHRCRGRRCGDRAGLGVLAHHRKERCGVRTPGLRRGHRPPRLPPVGDLPRRDPSGSGFRGAHLPIAG